jgi:hypothetical protein
LKIAISAAIVSLLVAAPVVVQPAISAAAAAPVATKGKMLFDSTGARLAPVYRVDSDGSAEIVFEGRMVTVPGTTLSLTSDGKLTTSLKKVDVIALP